MKRLIEIQKKLKAPKNQYNSFGKYKYRSCEDILEGVKPLLAELKVALVITDEICLIGDRYYVKATAQLLDEENILRSDEIWIVDKREGASVLYTHNDFKEHHTISRLRGYNEGRYGGIRFVKLND